MATPFETEMGVMPEIAKAVEEMEWNLPTDIQAEAIPLILGGGDVLMAAETGSGKTGAFCLPVMQVVFETMESEKQDKTSVDKKDKQRPADLGTGVSCSEPWRMSMHDRTGSLAVAPDGLLCQSRDPAGWHGARANKGVRGGGRHYYEAAVTDDGLCRVGWATLEANLELGTCPFGYGFGGTGKKSNGRQFTNYGSSFGNGDRIGCCLDLEGGTISWTKNGEDLGIAYPLPRSQLQMDAFFPAICFKNAEMRLNFGTEPLEGPLPTGYKPLCQAETRHIIVSDKKSVPVSATIPAPAKPQRRTGPLALVLEPSRELAEQTYKQLCLFKKYLPSPQPRTTILVGGGNAREQRAEVEAGAEIVVATPGRLMDFISNQNIRLNWVRFFVLDEADALLSQGHKDVLESTRKLMPRGGGHGGVQMIVCSATLHSFEVKRLAGSMMHFPQWVDLKGQDSVPETVHHVVCLVDPLADLDWHQARIEGRPVLTDGVHSQDQVGSGNSSQESLSQAVKLLKPIYTVEAIRKLAIDRSLIFCRTKIDCDNMEAMFVGLGGGPRSAKKHQFSCVCLHGDRPPRERKANLERFQNEDVRFLVCTDVAARGIDIKGLPYVINVTLPDEKQNYVHRIGRVGRAERMGLAVSLVSKVKEKVWYHSNCPNRGSNCHNTALTERGGCCIWYNEQRLLSDVEEHLGCTIDATDRRFQLQTDMFDGKVVYGQKSRRAGPAVESHAAILAPAVARLAELEKMCQHSYLTMLSNSFKV